MPFLATITTLMFGSMVVLLAFLVIPQANKELFCTGLGIMGTLAIGANAFYFGSSKGSEDKNKMLADSSPAVNVNSNNTLTP